MPLNTINLNAWPHGFFQEILSLMDTIIIKGHGRNASFQAPPHRSRRAELPHRAPASGNNAKANQWIWMADPGQWNPFDYQALHPIPYNIVLMTSAS